MQNLSALVVLSYLVSYGIFQLAVTESCLENDCVQLLLRILLVSNLFVMYRKRTAVRRMNELRWRS